MNLSQQSKTLLGASAMLAFFNLASRIMGLVRDRIFASHFGASNILDVYYISFQIPDLIFNLLAIGAVSTAFIPLFIEYENKDGKEAAWKLASNFLNVLMAGLFVGVVILFVFAPWLVNVIAPGFPEEKRYMATLFTRVMLFSPLIFAVSTVAGSVLQALNRFIAFAAAPLAYNLGIIIGAVVLEPMFGPLGLAEGVVLGAFLHLCVQIPALKRTGFRWFKIFDRTDRGVRRIFKLIVPRSFGLAAVQINWVVLNALATTLGVGAVAALNFAFNLQFVPIALVGISVAVATFPTMSREALTDRGVFAGRITKTLNGILFVIVPLSFLFAYLREDIVKILLGSGVFGAKDISVTSDILGFFVIGVFAQSVIPVLARAFYAMHDTKTPVLAGVASVVINILIALWFIGGSGISALPFSYALAGILNALILVLFLKKKVPEFALSTVTLNFLKIIYSSVVMLIVLVLADIFIDFGVGLAGSILQIVVFSSFGTLIFWVLSSILGVENRPRITGLIK